MKDYQDALAGKNGLRVLDYDENTHTFSDPKRKKLDFSNFASTKPATSVGARTGGASGSGSGSSVNKLEAEADRGSKSISDAYNRTFATAEESVKYWYDDQLDKLNIGLCVACGTCSFVCPAKRPVTQNMALAKAFYMGELRRKQAEAKAKAEEAAKKAEEGGNK